MTWLSVNTQAPDGTTHTNDLDALLALNSDAGKTLMDFLAVAEQVNDAALLDLCRLHMAQLLNCRAVLDTADEASLARLINWHKSPDVSEAECAVLDFTELFIVAPGHISSAQRANLAAALGVGEPSTFVYGLYINEAMLRFLTFFDVNTPYPYGLQNDTLDVGEKSDRKFIEWVDGESSNTDPTLLAAYYAFNRATCSLHGIDELTDEIVRLRSAEYHDCKFCQSVRRIVDKPAETGDLMSEVRDYHASKVLTPRQKAALEVLDAFLVAPANLSATLKARIEQHFTPTQLVELLLKEMFWMSNKPMISLGTDPGAVSASALTPFEYDGEGNFVLMTG